MSLATQFTICRHARPGVKSGSRRAHIVRDVQHGRRSMVCRAAAAAAGQPSAEPPLRSQTPQPEAVDEVVAVPDSPPQRNLWQKIKHFFVGDKLDKERMAALGMGAFASYGVISNVTYGTCMVIAWISFVKATGQSPLAPGQWPGFLAFYAGLWTFQNFVRPLRFTFAMALAPLFNTYIDNIAAKTGLGKKWAFGILLVAMAITTASAIGLALYVFGGFPATTHA